MQTETTQTTTAAPPDPVGGLDVRQTAQGAGSRDARLSRVLDYQARSLEKDDPLEANLGSINSGLMRTALWLDEAIEQALQIGPPNIKRLPEISPAIETYLRVARQIDRFANIERQASEARKPRGAGKSHAALRSNAGVAPVNEQSEESEV